MQQVNNESSDTERKLQVKDARIKQLEQELAKTKKSLDLLERVLAVSPGNIYWKDNEGRFLGCNDNVAKIFNLASNRDIQGKTNHDLFAANLAVQTEQADRLVISTNREQIFEEKGLSANLEPAIYLSRKVPLTNEQGQIIGIVGVSVDISERKRLESELIAAKDAAEQANQAKSEFLMNMGHDLRTPFSGILSMTNLLYQAEQDSAKKELQQLIIISSRRLLALLNDVMELSKLGSNPIAYSKFNIRSVVQEVVDLFAAETKAKKLSLLFDCLDSEFISDKLRFTRIILNLVGNAIKFTDKGWIKLSVKVETELEIIVEDTGIGIADGKLDLIFDKFSKLTPSNQHADYRGTGLGLYIVKQFAEELGGTAGVTSRLNQGSRFTVKLPLTNSTIS